MVTKEQITRLKALIRNGADAELFFSSLKKSDWLPALLEIGSFNSPPVPEKVGDGVRHAPWPQSRYLARIASQSPEQAVEAALTIPSTGNSSVNGDILRVALTVSPTLASKLMPRLSEWLKRANIYSTSDDAGKLIAHVSKGSGYEEALNLFGVLISFAKPPEDANASTSEGEDTFNWGVEPTARFDEYNYNQLLNVAIPALAARDPMLTLRVLTRALNSYVDLKMGKSKEGDEDHSLYWRPSIEEHPQNSHNEEVSALISAIRKHAESVVTSDPSRLQQVLETIAKYHTDIFTRLRFHLLRVFLEKFEPTLIRETVLDSKRWVDGRWDLEFGQLLGAAFGKLSIEDRSSVLALIDKGPGPEDLKWLSKAIDGTQETPERVERGIIRWKVTKLHWIKDSLPSDWKHRYEGWVAQVGVSEHPGFQTWSGGGQVGTQSPRTLENLRAITIAEQAAYLRSWAPDLTKWDGPTREALGTILQELVKSDTLRYLAEARAFTELEPIYVTAFFRGTAEGLKGLTVPDWAPLWDLADWALQQGDLETEVVDEFTRTSRRGRRWRGVRLEIGRFLEAALKGQMTTLNLEERQRIWFILETLAGDPDPSSADESKKNRGSFGPLTMSLNTVRGEAIHGIFSYLAWLYHSTPPEEQAAFTLRKNAPDCARLLESLLEPAKEPTQTVRSVFGANANRLFYWDKEWFIANRDKIFPPGDSGGLWDAAWTTFIKYSNPYPDALDALVEQFKRAVREAGNPIDENERDDPRVSLGHHLMVAYWLGHLLLEEKGGLLDQFFTKAPDDVRARTLNFVGRSLKDTEGAIPAETMSRIKALWERRLETARKANGVGFDKEMAAFGSWLGSKKFDSDWAAGHLVAALALTKSTGERFFWMESLVAMAEQHPFEAAKGLELIMQNVLDQHVPFWKEEEAEFILKTALKSGKDTAISAAKGAQNILLKLGHRRFLNVLKKD